MRIAIAWALAAVSLSHALVGDWTSYTSMQVIRDLEGSGSNLFVATTGGIRRIDAKGVEKDYRNTEGLRDVGISGLAVSPEGEMYATSELGYVYRYASGPDDWEIIGTSYRSAGWKMNKRAVAYRAGYLVLGTQKGLSFFNVGKKVADANVTKMASATSLSVNAVLFVGDTLFAGTNHGIFKALLHLDKLLTDPAINIYNPAIWTQVPGTDGVLFYDPASPGDDTTYRSDSLKAVADINANKPANVDDAGFFSHGALYYGAAGIGSDYEGSSWSPRDARVSAYGDIIIDGKFNAKSTRLESIIFWGGKWYVGNANGLYGFDPVGGVGFEVLSPETVPRGGVTAIRANRYGVHAFSTPNVFTLNGKKWDKVPEMEVGNDYIDSKLRGQHAFDVFGSESFAVGTWGHGFRVFRDGKNIPFDASNSCIVSAVEGDPNYPVIWSEAMYKDKGIWMVNWLVNKGYHFAYYDLAKGTLQCFEPQSKDIEPRNLQIVGDSVLTVITEKGLEAYRIHDDGSSVSVDPANLLTDLGGAGDEPLAGKMDHFGNFWVTTKGSSLFYVPSIIFKRGAVQSFKALDGFPGSACANLESDPQGHVWAGCGEGGVIEIIPGKDSLSHTFHKYGLNDGLLSEVVYDLEVNPENGDIWVATEKGLARYESASRPIRNNLSTLKVYPNPFLARHSHMVFANLSPGSEVQVTTQSGSVVYHKTLAAGTGDQIQWDGRNQAGERVREGVYFYVVRSPKETKNGKIIVAR